MEKLRKAVLFVGLLASLAAAMLHSTYLFLAALAIWALYGLVCLCCFWQIFSVPRDSHDD